MLAYAANSRPAGRAGSPHALIFVVAGHAVLIGAVMTAKMDLVSKSPFDPTDVVMVPLDEPTPAPPKPPAPDLAIKPPTTVIDRTPVIVDVPLSRPTLPLDQGPPLVDFVPNPGVGPGVTPALPAKPAPVRAGPRFATPESALRPPYPLAKLRAEEETTLRLRLSIDARGRVTSVEPVGSADPQFLDAARRHIIKAWRYKPATEDGAAVASSTVITLSFRLDDA